MHKCSRKSILYIFCRLARIILPVFPSRLLSIRVSHALDIESLLNELKPDLRQTIAMTTTAMMKTKVAVADPTISGSCSCHGFGGSALEVKERKWLTGELVAKIYPL